MHGGMDFGMGWMWIWPLVVLVVLAVAAWALLQPRRGKRADTPEEILARRYARGEIDDDEYPKRLEELRR